MSEKESIIKIKEHLNQARGILLTNLNYKLEEPYNWSKAFRTTPKRLIQVLNEYIIKSREIVFYIDNELKEIFKIIDEKLRNFKI